MQTYEKTYSVDIRTLVASLGIQIIEMPMVDPVTAVFSCDDETPVLTLNALQSEIQKRYSIATAMAICLEEGKAVSCIITEPVGNVAKRARGLLMPKDAFIHEYERLESFGKLRCSILATLFKVGLSDVLQRLQDLGMEM